MKWGRNVREPGVNEVGMIIESLLDFRAMKGEQDERKAGLTRWADTTLAGLGLIDAGELEVETASDDASFRRYFRGSSGGQSWILMDAPPALEDSEPFVRIGALIRAADVNAPELLASDLDAGYLLLEDFGDALYASVLASGDADRRDGLYDDALAALVRMQRIDADLPVYDTSLLQTEMRLFTEWFLPKQLGIEISEGESRLLDDVMSMMVEAALAQPRVFVHRDYHCRNLMIVAEDNPGVLDFQDAVAGPVTYDLVSLLRDAYHRFDPPWIDDRLMAFRERAGLGAMHPDELRRWFDFMGIQRHLKVAGIFSRLNLRDGKPRYLADIPRVVGYLHEVAARYEELQPFATWLEARILPRMSELVPA